MPTSLPGKTICMSTHTTEQRGTLDVDSVCDFIEAHGSGVAMVMLWIIPVLALVVAILHT